MPHITLNSEDPGIRGLLRYRPETAQPMSGLIEVLLRGPSTLTRGERELIAAHVSALNECRYCTVSHSATAAAQARAAGATDLELHDTVLIAAAFCMVNRYVDGLATITPDDPAVYAAGAQRLIAGGYLPPSPPMVPPRAPCPPR